MTLALAEQNPTQAPRSAADPLWRAMGWQLALTAALALACGVLLSVHGALSALLGGLVSVAAAAVFRFLVRRSRSRLLMDTMMVMLKAEAAKVAVIIVGLLLCFVFYKQVVALALVGTFIVTTLVFAFAAFAAPARTPHDPS